MITLAERHQMRVVWMAGWMFWRVDGGHKGPLIFLILVHVSRQDALFQNKCPLNCLWRLNLKFWALEV